MAFAEVNVASSVSEGILNVAQANGMAGIESNTVLLGWPEKPERLPELLRVIGRFERIHKSLVIGRPPESNGGSNGRSRTVDVWWGGLQRNSDLMLLLAYLLTRNREWRDAHIRVLSVASNELMKDETERLLAKLIPAIRIEAEVEVFVKPPDASVRSVIHEKSADADLVLLGLATPKPGEEAAYAERLIELAGGLRSFFLVKNNTLFMGDLVSSEGEEPLGRVPLQVKAPPAEESDGVESTPTQRQPPA